MPLPKPDAIRVAVLQRLATRHNQAVINASAIAHGQLTRGEVCTVIPNAAIMDRQCLAALSPREPSLRPDPVGATDLTNQLNEPTERVLLHPVISLWSDIAHGLEQRNAPPSLCSKVRDVIGSVESVYRKQLSFAGLKEEWPDFRKNFETSMIKKGAVPESYWKRRPRAGCSTEFVLDVMARDGGMVPDFTKLDRLALRGQLIKKGIPPQLWDHEIEMAYLKNLGHAQEQLYRWDAFTKTAGKLFDTEVTKPQERVSQCWHYACKALSSEDVKRIVSLQDEIGRFAATRDSVDKIALNQATETAVGAISGPCFEEDIIGRGLTLGEKVAASLMTKVGKKAVEGAMETATSSVVTATTGGVGLIAYLAARAAACWVAPEVEKKLEDLVEKGAAKVASWARQSTANMVHEESRASHIQQVSVDLVAKQTQRQMPLAEVLPHLTPVGQHTAHLLVDAYESATNPENFERLTSFIGAEPEDWHLRLAAAIDPDRGLDEQLNLNPAGLELPTCKDPAENAAMSRMVYAFLVESATDVGRVAGSPAWSIGKNRLTHRLEQSRTHLKNILSVEDPSIADEQGMDEVEFFDHALEEECCRNLARATTQALQLVGDRYVFSGAAVSRLLQSTEMAHAQSSSIRRARPSNSYDWSILCTLNSHVGLAQPPYTHLHEEIDQAVGRGGLAHLFHPASHAENVTRAEKSVESIVLPRVEPATPIS